MARYRTLTEEQKAAKRERERSRTRSMTPEQRAAKAARQRSKGPRILTEEQRQAKREYDRVWKKAWVQKRSPEQTEKERLRQKSYREKFGAKARADTALKTQAEIAKRKEQKRAYAARKREQIRQEKLKAKSKRPVAQRNYCSDCHKEVSYRKPSQAGGRCWDCYKLDVARKADARRVCYSCQKNRVYTPGNRCRECWDKDQAIRYSVQATARNKERKARVSDTVQRHLEEQHLRAKRLAKRNPGQWYLQYAPGLDWILVSTCPGRTMSQPCTNGMHGLPARLICPGLCYKCATGRERKHRAPLVVPKSLLKEQAQDIAFAEELVA
jgi:hypothetical protein